MASPEKTSSGGKSSAPLLGFEVKVWLAPNHPLRKNVLPKGQANFTWVRHFIHHLSPQGMANLVLANDRLPSNKSGKDDIRCALIETELGILSPN